jgi:hypothetical protein
MGEGAELAGSTLRAVLYTRMELQKALDGVEVLRHLALSVPDWHGDSARPGLAAGLTGYPARRLEAVRSAEASAARVLRELVLNQPAG